MRSRRRRTIPRPARLPGQRDNSAGEESPRVRSERWKLAFSRAQARSGTLETDRVEDRPRAGAEGGEGQGLHPTKFRASCDTFAPRSPVLSTDALRCAVFCNYPSYAVFICLMYRMPRVGPVWPPTPGGRVGAAALSSRIK